MCTISCYHVDWLCVSQIRLRDALVVVLILPRCAVFPR